MPEPAKTTMLNRARALLEKRGYELKGLAPSASAAQTLAAEANIETETLQRFLARNAGIAEGRLTAQGRESNARGVSRKPCSSWTKASLASTVQMRATSCGSRRESLRLPRVVLVGDGKQLDAVDAGKPFVQLQQAGMKTATMDQIMRQKEPETEGGGGGKPQGRYPKSVRETRLERGRGQTRQPSRGGRRGTLAQTLAPQERENTGLMAPSHALREQINEIVRERLTREGKIRGPAMNSERLVSRSYTNAEKRWPRTTSRATWFRSTARTSDSVWRKAMNCVSGASTIAQVP